MKRHVLEFLGTFFVVLAVSLTENPMAIGLIYLALIYVGARVSGAHYNPSITLALWLRGEFATHRIWGYWAAQLLGAFVALVFEYKLSGSLFTPDIAPEDQVFFICALEFLFTFVLCYVFLATRTIKAIRESHLYGIILGFTLVGLTSMGGLFNAAIGCASLVLRGIYGGDIQVHMLNNILVYIVCPLLGAVAAGFAFDYLEVPADGEFVGVESIRK
jgi:aquaporin Z